MRHFRSKGLLVLAALMFTIHMVLLTVSFFDPKLDSEPVLLTYTVIYIASAFIVMVLEDIKAILDDIKDKL
jgi:hypothetical protein